MRLPLGTIAAICVALVFAPACGQDSSGPSPCAAHQTMLSACGILSDGVLPPCSAESVSQGCLLSCSAAASCTEVQQSLCGLGAENPLEQCMTDCSTVACGDTEDRVSQDSICDGWSDCANGWDEQDCPGMFACADGTGSVDMVWVCDEWEDCSDGSDELNCADAPAEANPVCDDGQVAASKSQITTGSASVCQQAVSKLAGCGLLTAGHFDCETPDTQEDQCLGTCMVALGCSDLEIVMCGGVEVPPPAVEACFDKCIATRACPEDPTQEMSEDWFCDGYEDCPEGGDELDCPGMFYCADGNGSVQPEYLCDGWEDCDDASDETGCAELICDPDALTGS